ncbi:unnamed protein product [Vitrella brassicaformis CCMP3155]|uniref:Uncharacterized protein n=1 Tax=Vitrella brassicaformis (strain CCMP3155) TaxID=1169540 RepID=A0A0G4FX51_VITBC|nr:unnamed protein product [Vitrella brassicaformis CCMP3155]|eukprot:CEM19402.1 unnamed protein product [Vitrella brassicaformis CCMP3155]
MGGRHSTPRPQQQVALTSEDLYLDESEVAAASLKGLGFVDWGKPQEGREGRQEGDRAGMTREIPTGCPEADVDGWCVVGDDDNMPATATIDVQPAGGITAPTPAAPSVEPITSPETDTQQPPHPEVPSADEHAAATEAPPSEEPQAGPSQQQKEKKKSGEEAGAGPPAPPPLPPASTWRVLPAYTKRRGNETVITFHIVLTPDDKRVRRVAIKTALTERAAEDLKREQVYRWYINRACKQEWQRDAIQQAYKEQWPDHYKYPHERTEEENKPRSDPEIAQRSIPAYFLYFEEPFLRLRSPPSYLRCTRWRCPGMYGRP